MGADSKSPRSSTEQTLTANSPTTATLSNTRSEHFWQHAPTPLSRRKSSGRISERRPSLVLDRTMTRTGKQWWKFTLRPWDDNEEQDWWFASTAIPLLAATIGPLANVFSIAALVTYWRMCLVVGVSPANAEQCVWNGDRNSIGPQLEGVSFADPHWCYYLNVASLVVGFVGNFFLLCNFTQRIRYIIALPVTIVCWYVATGILIGITVSMDERVPPIRPQQTYTQGFWYAVLAAAMYMVCSMALMVNMLGYFLGHYPQHFSLTDSQRTLILQTMMFFLWLAAGGALFSAVERKYGDGEMNWAYVNALYFCDVTILTVGFGDLYATTSISRGLVFPYSVGGIIMLGLMVSSIAKFAGELGSEKIIRKHVERTRARTVGRTVTTSLELEHRRVLDGNHRPTISGPLNPVDQSKLTRIQIPDEKDTKHANVESQPNSPISPLRRVATLVTKPRRQRKPKLILLREEKDRFLAMRHIQMKTTKFKRWYSLCLSIVAFALLWNVGAAVFWQCERIERKDFTYFRGLYFCYVSLLTIGYGDLAPITNTGRPFFVLWSLIAVPTMTILISDLGDTVINKFKQGTFKLADFTVLPKEGVWREISERHPWILNWIQKHKERKELRRRFEEGFEAGPEPERPLPTLTLEELAKDEPSNQELAQRLAKKVRETADDMKFAEHKRYSYEEWVEFTQLIRFTAAKDGDEDVDEEEGLIEWDWIGEDSPMMSKGSEAEFVLDRLCESMQRYIRTMSKSGLDGDDELRRPPTQRSVPMSSFSLRR